MRLFAILLFAVVMPTPTRSCGLDLFGVCGGAEKVARELDQLPDKIRKASEQVLNHLFNDLLPPTIDKITAAAQQLEDRAETDYEKAVNATRAQLEQLAEKVVQLAEEYAKDVTKDVEQIVNLVAKDMSALLQSVISDVDQRVNSLLSRLEYYGKELFCAAQGYSDILQKEFSSYFQKQDCECVHEMLKINPGLAQDCDCTSCSHIGEFYPWCKCNPWGMQFGPGWYNQGKYDFLKCHLQKAIDWEHWTVDQVVKQLSIVQEAALSFRCLEDMNPGSTGNRDYFTNEYTNITHTILVWTKSPTTIRGSLPAGPMQAMSLVRVPRVGDDPCTGKTIQECVTQAMSQLESARLDLQKTKDDFSNEMAEERAELSAAMKETHQKIQDKADASQVEEVASQVTALGQKTASQVDDLGARIASAQVSTDCRDVATPANDDGRGDLRNLDRHNVACGDGERLTKWHLTRPADGTMQVNYRCCKEQITAHGMSGAIVV